MPLIINISSSLTQSAIRVFQKPSGTWLEPPVTRAETGATEPGGTGQNQAELGGTGGDQAESGGHGHQVLRQLFVCCGTRLTFTKAKRDCLRRSHLATDKDSAAQDIMEGQC